MQLLLTGDFDAAEQAEWADALRQALPGHTLWVGREAVPVSAQALVEVAIVANPPPGSLAGLPGLRLVQSLWAGVDRLLADPGLPADVPLARMVDPWMNAAMAETALWAVLSLHRGFFGYQRHRPWACWPALQPWPMPAPGPVSSSTCCP
jgi:glyoxylate/hydroxypyruvate reductase